MSSKQVSSRSLNIPSYGILACNMDHSLETRGRNSASYSSTNTRRKTLPVGDLGICAPAINNRGSFSQVLGWGTDLVDDGNAASQPLVPTERLPDPRVEPRNDLGRTERLPIGR